MTRQRRLLALVPALVLAAMGRAAPSADEVKAKYAAILAAFSRDRMKADARGFADLGSRLAGSKGEAAALDLAERELRAMGATTRREPFDVTVPDPEARGTVEFPGGRTELLPLWPNLVRTSTCDVSGPLLYGGDGTLEALSGKRVEGRIVVMEFGTGARWRNAAKLGARGVVFLEPDAMPRAEAEAKFASVPLDVPRFYLPKRNAGRLLTAAFAGARAHLVCRQDWVTRGSANLVAEFPASAPGRMADESIAIFTPADAASVVPGLAPGGEGAAGLAATMEIARVAVARPHRRPLWVVVSGAHALGLKGAREFVERQFHGARTPFLTLALDLSGGSPSLGSFGQGWYCEYRAETRQHVDQTSRLFRTHADLLSAVTGTTPARLVLIDADNGSDSRTFKNNIPGKFALDCEPMILAGLNALGLRTVEDGRETCDTPFDTLERVKLGNVFRQAGTVACMLDHALNDTDDKNETSEFRIPLDRRTPDRMSLVGGFCQAAGKVVVYDPQKSFVPDVPVPGSLACVLGGQKTMMGVRGDLIQATVGPKAEYEFSGIPSAASMGFSADKWTRLAAFHLDPKTGAIDHAVTLNTPGFEAYDSEFPQTVARRESPIVVFPCVPVSVFDLVDPQELKALPRMRIVDARSGSFPRNFGLFSPGYDQRLSPEIEDAQVAFFLKGQRFQILGGMPGEGNRLILTNSSKGDEKGTGYAAPGAEGVTGRAAITLSGRFPDLPLNTARDLCALNEERLGHFEKYRIVSAGVRTLHEQAEAAIARAEAAKGRMDWAEADRRARAAWGYALRAHPIIMGTANDVVNGVVFYLFLLIPFSYFLERLLFGFSLLTKQLGAGVGIFIVSFLVLRLIHPAFEIVSNPSMIFIAFVMGVLSLVVTSFILGKFESNMRAVKAAQGGVHEVDVKRSSVAMAAFNLGVSNMRRRKARTVLTTLTLVVMTFIVLSFTSIVDELRLDETPAPNPAVYSGLMVRKADMSPLQLSTYRQIANEFGDKATVVRRTYYYGADIDANSLLTLQRGQTAIDVRAMLGVDPDETKVTRPQDALLPGGRWFRPGERNVTILPTGIANRLKIGPKDVGTARVTYVGEEFTVVGLVDAGIMRGKTDLDGDGLYPPDFNLTNTRNSQEKASENAFRPYIRIDPDFVFLVPAQTAMDLGSDFRTLAVAFPDPAATRPALESLMPRLRLNLYASVPEKGGLAVKQFSVQQAKASGGLVLVAIQILIAATFVLNTMVASVVERTKEISIFSSIGLAPNHIAMLFFAESLVYGVLGSVAGYYVAQGTAKIIVATGWLPGLTLNFSSTSAVLSATIVMATVLLSTIYPARKAARIAAPAMNEEAFETDPEGDEWRLPLPFSISAAEAGPVAAFLTAWLKAYEGYTIGDFVTAESRMEAEGGTYTVRATTWLAPYDLGVSQTLALSLSPSIVPGVYTLDLVMVRLAGDPENWPVVNRRFLANVRRQFLTWRALGSEERERYREVAEGKSDPDEGLGGMAGQPA